MNSTSIYLDLNIYENNLSNISNSSFTNNSFNISNNNTLNSTKDSGCELLGEFGYFVQGILGILSFAVLVFKRYTEVPKRTWKVWFFDSSKQLISAGVAHLLNIIIAIFLSAHSEGGDSCVWYLINLFIDSTIGMLICCLMLYFLNKAAESNNWRDLKSGLYFEFYVKDGKLKNRLKISMYFWQLFSWLVIVIISKFILAFLQYYSNSWLHVIGSAVLYPVKNNSKLKLVIVMVVFPIILNSIQFWVTDNFLKLKKEVYPQLELPKNNQLQYENPDIGLKTYENKNKSDKDITYNIKLDEDNPKEIQIDFVDETNDKENLEIDLKESKIINKNDNSYNQIKLYKF